MVIVVIVLFMVIANLQTWAQENTQTVHKELPALKTDQPPTIDGVLDDACWQDAPQATGFTDERTEKPAKNQSVGRVIYTDTAIYIDFTSTMICPIELWRARPKIRREFGEKTGFRLVLIRFIHTSFPTEISLS